MPPLTQVALCIHISILSVQSKKTRVGLLFFFSFCTRMHVFARRALLFVELWAQELDKAMKICFISINCTNLVFLSIFVIELSDILSNLVPNPKIHILI